MRETMQFFRLQQEKIILKIRVQPGAKKTELIGIHGDFLKVRIKTAPIDGKANEALIEWLSKLFDVPRRYICITRGFKSNNKTVLIDHFKMDYETFISKLNLKLI